MLQIAIALIIGFALGYGVREWVSRRRRQAEARLKDIRLLPGMPGEVFIQTHERTPLQYLLKPLQEQIVRASDDTLHTLTDVLA
jgi:hypothetical protein